MKTCDCCGKTKPTKDFCNSACRMAFVRAGAQVVPLGAQKPVKDVLADAQDVREGAQKEAVSVTNVRREAHKK